ncbi:hypothetical protein DOTSEDRAFT_48938 [Dothistroma septosporum NZE10]|uniref:Ketoreductase (KR) domain-containing protein n=1 Tax=Dothistroma septosporum (strain NZE10 / CBS 128990) TaxID=675120 RepID=N1PYF8_DOTSN|nr:hypothetical protein DOTSEDRAFT_48938 [Dothistroma septosporum NZE10]
MAPSPIKASPSRTLILIIEASQNPGCDAARALAKKGANLAFQYSHPAMRLTVDYLHQELKASYPDLAISTYQGDLSTSESIDALFMSVLEQHQAVDFVVKQDGDLVSRAARDVSEGDSYKALASAVFVDDQRRVWMERCTEAMRRARARVSEPS